MSYQHSNHLYTLVKWLINKMKNRGGRRKVRKRGVSFPIFYWYILANLKLVCFEILKSVFCHNLTRRSCIIIWKLVLFLIQNGCSSFWNPLKFKEWKITVSWNKQYLNHCVYLLHVYYFVHYNLRKNAFIRLYFDRAEA